MEHDRKEETMVVGVQRHDGGGHTWQLRVCGVLHGEGKARHAADAFAQAAFKLNEEADAAVGQ